MNDDKPEIGLADEQDLVPTEEEARDAAELASSVDRLLAGEPGESNDLMMAAVMIRSSMREQHLEQECRDALIQQAMRDVLARARPRSRRVASFTPLMALAASLLLALGAGWMMWRTSLGGSQAALAPRQMLSRSSNELMGRPFTDRAGASRRIDLVYADRLDGYRQVVLARGKP